MASKVDFSPTSRFRTDPGFQILNRKNLTIGTINLMPPPVRANSDRVYVATPRHEFRWDLLAFDMLGDVSLKWVIMRHNRVSDPLIGPLVGQRFFIPNARQIQYYLNQRT